METGFQGVAQADASEGDAAPTRPLMQPTQSEPRWAPLAAAVSVFALAAECLEGPYGRPTVLCGSAATLGLERGIVRTEEMQRDGCVPIEPGLGASPPSELRGTQLALAVLVGNLPSLWDSDLAAALQVLLLSSALLVTACAVRRDSSSATRASQAWYVAACSYIALTPAAVRGLWRVLKLQTSKDPLLKPTSATAAIKGVVDEDLDGAAALQEQIRVLGFVAPAFAALLLLSCNLFARTSSSCSRAVDFAHSLGEPISCDGTLVATGCAVAASIGSTCCVGLWCCQRKRLIELQSVCVSGASVAVVCVFLQITVIGSAMALNPFSFPQDSQGVLRCAQRLERLEATDASAQAPPCPTLLASAARRYEISSHGLASGGLGATALVVISVGARAYLSGPPGSSERRLARVLEAGALLFVGVCTVAIYVNTVRFDTLHEVDIAMLLIIVGSVVGGACDARIGFVLIYSGLIVDAFLVWRNNDAVGVLRFFTNDVLLCSIGYGALALLADLTGRASLYEALARAGTSATLTLGLGTVLLLSTYDGLAVEFMMRFVVVDPAEAEVAPGLQFAYGARAYTLVIARFVLWHVAPLLGWLCLLGRAELRLRRWARVACFIGGALLPTTLFLVASVTQNELPTEYPLSDWIPITAGALVGVVPVFLLSA